MFEFWEMAIIVLVPFCFMIFEYYCFKKEIDLVRSEYDKKILDLSKEIELLKFNVEHMQSCKKKKDVD